MHYLFGEYGLIIIDPNSKNLKNNISDIIVDDIVNNTIEKIEKSSGEVSDVYVRKVNFFYQESDLRERIDKTDKYAELHAKLASLYSEGSHLDGKMNDLKKEDIIMIIIIRASLYKKKILLFRFWA